MQSLRLLSLPFILLGVTANIWDNLASIGQSPIASVPQNFSLTLSTDSPLFNLTGVLDFQGASNSFILRLTDSLF